MRSSDVDYASFELGCSRPCLRDDLRFTTRESSRGNWYIVEDEANSKYYRIGRAEYIFLSLLDGNRTLESAVAATASQLKNEAFSETEAASLCKWLVESGLATKERNDEKSFQESRQRKKVALRLQWLNPIMLRVPIGNPDPLVTRLTGALGWLLSWPILVIWSLMVVVATCFVLTADESVFNVDSRPIIARDNWIWLGLTWLLLRVLHETAHAVTCKRYGGAVREWGILLLMFIPLPYVDVTSAWRFTSRLHRVLTSAAGILVEIFIASLAAIVWCHTDSGLVRQHALNVVIAAGITTILFNANPLMRFDGYHIIADTLDIPNLWTHGRQFVRSFFRRWYLGIPAKNPPWDRRQASFIRMYGWASMAWTTAVFVSITLAALSILDGFGLLLATLAATLWCGIPTFRVLRFISAGSQLEQPNRLRFVFMASLTIGCVTCAGVAIPAPSVVSAPLVIEHDPLAVLRNKTPGFVDEIRVQSRQRVNAGEIICILENIDLRSELADTRLKLKESELRVRNFQSTGEPAAMQYELESTGDLRRRVAELERQIDELTIRSTISGTVVSPDISHLLGTYVQTGTEIVALGGDEGRRGIALVPQADAEPLFTSARTTAQARLWGSYGGTFTGHLRRVNPRAQTRLPHFSFAATAGGPLTVRDSGTPETEPLEQYSKPLADDTRWVLEKPHVELEIDIEADGRSISSGQTGILYIRARDLTLGAYVISNVKRYLRERIKRTHGL